MKTIASLSLVFGFAAAALVQGQSQATPWDHVHFMVPDPPAAIEWYARHFGAEPKQTPPTYMMLGQTRLDFAKSATPKPSAGTSVDHIGFSVPDLDAKMKSLRTTGAIAGYDLISNVLPSRRTQQDRLQDARQRRPVPDEEKQDRVR